MLDGLKREWGDAYLIGQDGERGWWAARRHQIGVFVSADDPDELRRAIGDDYGVRLVKL